MALFSFRHSVKTFSKKATTPERVAKFGQTASHLRYIMRASAARIVLSNRIPFDNPLAAATEAERLAAQSSGRVCERFTVALPLEAKPAERVALAKAYAEQLTAGLAGYVVAIHDAKGNDVNNPHFHLVCFDLSVKSGGRGRPRSVLCMSHKNAVERAAETWATLHNAMMLEWGYGLGSLIDHRSYAERNIDRIPTIHEGVVCRKIEPTRFKAPNAQKWKKVDQGHSRAEANEIIREINFIKEELNERDTDRLGEFNERYTHSRQDRLPWERAIDWSGSGDARSQQRREDRTTESHDETVATGQPSRSTGRNDEGTGIGGCHGERSPFDRVSGQGEFKTAFPQQFGVPRRFRVRRLFHELLLIRDTLRARLARRLGLGLVEEFFDEAARSTDETPSSRDTGNPSQGRTNRHRHI